MTDTTQNGGKSYPRNFHANYSKPRRDIITTIFDMMTTDYGNGFTRQFDEVNGTQIYDWKCRFLEMASPFDDEVVINAADNVCRENPDYPPNLRQIETEMRRINLDNAKKKQQDEALKNMKADNPAGQQRVSSIMGGLANGLKGKQDFDPQKFLEKAIVYESLMWTFLPDKSFPMTRKAAALVKESTGSNQEIGEIAALAAKRIGGDVLSMFTQIVDFMRPQNRMAA